MSVGGKLGCREFVFATQRNGATISVIPLQEDSGLKNGMIIYKKR